MDWRHSVTASQTETAEHISAVTSLVSFWFKCPCDFGERQGRKSNNSNADVVFGNHNRVTYFHAPLAGALRRKRPTRNSDRSTPASVRCLVRIDFYPYRPSLWN